MIFHVLTIFPEFFHGPLDYGVLARARKAGLLEVRLHNLRDYAHDRHRTVDDRPFGGGEGMVLKPDPIFEAVETIWPQRHAGRRVILLSAQGRLFNQKIAHEMASCEELFLICGRYEGVDERVALHLADDEISIGDYVLSGGELAAAVLIDVVARLLPGVLGNEASARSESFSGEGDEPAILDYPQYTRPADFRSWRVPEVLLSGHHAEIRRWRRQAAREKTLRLRPDLLQRRAPAREPKQATAAEPVPAGADSVNLEGNL